MKEDGDAQQCANFGNQEERGTLGDDTLRSLPGPYLTTVEAAQYLRKSVSWLLRQPDIPYLPGKPNLYAKADLDDWFERSKFRPKVT